MTYQTSSGFFDLAVAAPSMKAAAEAWRSRTNVEPPAMITRSIDSE